jgi:hypothetical protein
MRGSDATAITTCCTEIHPLLRKARTTVLLKLGILICKTENSDGS